MEKAVVSLGDESFQPLTDITFPWAKAYAEKIGADFIHLKERKYPFVNICYEKLQIGELLKAYERVLYVDGDVLIHPRSPDIFEVVPFGMFGAMNEAANIYFWNEGMILKQFSPYGWKGPWNGIHFNAGVMVLDRTHGALFEDPVITNLPYWDQPYFNVSVFQKNIPYYQLPPEWNCLVYHRYKSGPGIYTNAFFRHFSGGTSFQDKVRDARAAAEKFKELSR